MYFLLTLNGVSGILFANFQRFLVLGALVPSVHRFEAIPNLNCDTLWRSASHCRDRFCSGTCSPSDEEKASTSRFDGRLVPRRELFAVSFRVRYIDFSDEIELRFALGMQASDS